MTLPIIIVSSLLCAKRLKCLTNFGDRWKKVDEIWRGRKEDGASGGKGFSRRGLGSGLRGKGAETAIFKKVPATMPDALAFV